MRMTPKGEYIDEDGGTLEDYELMEQQPEVAQFIGIGRYAHSRLRKGGYAYGPLVGVRHADGDEELGNSVGRKGMFPMLIVLTVMEDDTAWDGEGNEEANLVEVNYEVTLGFDPIQYVRPGLVVASARKLTAEGMVAAVLEVPPTEENSFFEKNRRGITLMLGVIIASAVVRVIRRGIEVLLARWKRVSVEGKAEQQGEDSSEATEKKSIKQAEGTLKAKSATITKNKKSNKNKTN